MKYFLAVDLGGTKINACLINQKGKILIRKKELTKKRLTPKKLINQIVNLANNFLAIRKIKKEELKAIGLAVPGPVDSKKGLLIYPPNLQGIKEINLVKPIKMVFKKPVFLLNDANAATLTEWQCAGKVSPLIYLTISTGIGGGVIIDGKLYQGQGFAPEPGHMIIDLRGPKCRCGNYGCVEALCSGTARTKKTGLFPALVYQRARQGDKKAQKIVEENNKNLAVGLVNLIHLFNPKKIVLGGGIMESRDWILPSIRKMVRKKIMPAFRRTELEIVRSKLGGDNVLLGLYIYLKNH